MALPPVPPTFQQSILAQLDYIRGIAGQLGLRPYTVTVQVNTYPGAARVGGPGGTKVTKSLVLTNTLGPNAQPVRVRQRSRKDIVASGGLYTDREFTIGPMTPAYAAFINAFAGGATDTQLDPEATATPTEIVWNIAGPGLPTGGGSFEKVGEEATSLHYFLTLRQTGQVSV